MPKDGFFHLVTQFPQVGIEVMSEIASLLYTTRPRYIDCRSPESMSRHKGVTAALAAKELVGQERAEAASRESGLIRCRIGRRRGCWRFIDT